MDNDMMIPCGKCSGCRASSSRDWALRLYHESTLYEQSAFITLTYDEENVPLSINRKAVQNFIKRLRHSIKDLRYFACGEYGEKTRRPHYHAIIFGTDFLNGADHITDKLWSNPTLRAAWPFGHVSAGSFSIASSMYVSGYVQKKLHDHDTFSLMSKGSIKRTRGMLPPIGYRWAEKNIQNMLSLGRCMVGNQSFRIPRCYVNWFPELEYGKSNVVHLEVGIPQLRNRELAHNARRDLYNKEAI